MAGKLKTERERLEADLIRLDRTLALDRQKMNALKRNIDALTDDRLKIEARLCALRKAKP
jgi:chromosome segregation ATPase